MNIKLLHQVKTFVTRKSSGCHPGLTSLKLLCAILSADGSVTMVLKVDGDNYSKNRPRIGVISRARISLGCTCFIIPIINHCLEIQERENTLIAGRKK